jgi:hypothetical protein
MESISEGLMGMLSSGDNLSALSKSVGGDSNAVKSALGMGIPAIMGSMANNASKPGGLDMLKGLMSKADAANPTGDIGAMLSGGGSAGGSDMISGLMGGQLAPIQNAIAKKTGLPASVIGQVLAMVAPLVMGKVSKMFSSQKMDDKGLTALLGDQSKMAMQSSPDMADIMKQITGATGEKTGILAKLKGLFK